MISFAEQELLKGIVRTSTESLQDIHTLLGKIYDEDLALDLNRQAAAYSGIKEKAAKCLLDTGIVPEPVSILDRTKRWGTLQARTALNVSTGHIAEMLVKDEEERLHYMENIMHRDGVYGKEIHDLAERFLESEEQNIRVLKSYCRME